MVSTIIQMMMVSIVAMVVWVETMLILVEASVTSMPSVVEVVVFGVHVTKLVMSASIVHIFHRMVHLSELAVLFS